MYKSKELQFLNNRGYLKQLTHLDELDEMLCSDKKIAFYIGFDCTAKSLHVGHLIQIMIARYLISMGHLGIMILGTTTAKIGDPSGKNEQRKILTYEDIEWNFQSISTIIKKFIKSANSENEPIFLKNDWLENMTLVDFLRDYGVHFSVNKMVNMETFHSRLSNHKPLSFLEFSYSLFQAYDFLYLLEKYNCQLQIGGSDQWGNIIAGIDLVHKVHNNRFVCGMTTNLLLNSAGEKMGKTVGGAVWLSESMMDPKDYWQYFRNCDDGDIVKLFALLTDISDEEIEAMKEKISNNKDESYLNELKIILATKITEICHGSEIAKKIQSSEQMKFAKNINLDDLSNLNPDLTFNISEIKNKTILDLLKMVDNNSSNSQLKTLIIQNAIKLNRVVISDIGFILNEEFFSQSSFGAYLIVEIGKKKKVIVEIYH